MSSDQLDRPAPSAQHALGVPNSDRQWVVTACTLAVTVSAALLGLGTVLAVVLLPSRHRLTELRAAAAAPAPVPRRRQKETQFPWPWPAAHR